MGSIKFNVNHVLQDDMWKAYPFIYINLIELSNMQNIHAQANYSKMNNRPHVPHIIACIAIRDTFKQTPNQITQRHSKTLKKCEAINF